MVHVFGPLWVSRLPPGVTGPHGVLCAPGHGAQPIHSVLLVAADAIQFFVLDPFFSSTSQPFAVANAELLSVLSGFSSLVLEP